MKLSALFSDHAVLQRGIPIPIWGWTHPHTRVVVKIGSQQAHGISGADGKFLVRLHPMKEGGPYTLETATLGDHPESVTAHDIWIGEVWLASGQSNMEYTLAQIDNPEETAEMVCTSNIRMIKVPNSAYAGRQIDFTSEWKVANITNAPQFSAVGAHFAKFMNDHLDVKIGIINSSWGGTIIEAWTSRETLVQNPAYAGTIARYETDVVTEDFWRHASNLAKEPPYPKDPGNQGFRRGWHEPEFEDTYWKSMELPTAWTKVGHEYSGVFWFRKTVEIPPEWAGRDIILSLGAIDKHDVSYFNGEQIGATGSNFETACWNVIRQYVVPGRLVHPGKQTIAVRAYSFVFDGGLIGPRPNMYLKRVEGSDTIIPIDGEWKYIIEHNFGPVILPPPVPGPGVPNTPYMLYDNMIAPLIPYAIRGAIWYQGESNANEPAAYDRFLPDLVRDWRHAWGQGDFPFYAVQLANYGNEPGWPRLREAQLKILQEPNTGLAVAIDIGDLTDIHPIHKREVGRRLSLWALHQVHRLPIVCSGPLYQSMTIEGSSIRLHFSHIGGGLMAKEGALGGFTVAGNNRKFIDAQAVIDGETVVVSSPSVSEPVAVRYAWHSFPKHCNLYNIDGLPASPFRTDSWQ